MVTLGKSGKYSSHRFSSLTREFSWRIKAFPLFNSTVFPGWGPLPIHPALSCQEHFQQSLAVACSSPGFVEQRFLLISAGPSSTRAWQARLMKDTLHSLLCVEIFEEGLRNICWNTEKATSRGREKPSRKSEVRADTQEGWKNSRAACGVWTGQGVQGNDWLCPSELMVCAF